MIAISYLFEKGAQYEPFMTGVAKQIGGHGYPTAQYRSAMAPPSVQAAEAEAEEAMAKAQKIQMIRDIRRRKNPTQAERAQGAY
jgi:hypothetical protein